MSKTPILTDKAPKPLPGIYSQAIVANGFVYCSGAVPMDPVSMKIEDGDIQAHTVSSPLRLWPHESERICADLVCLPQHQCIKNLSVILEHAGSDITKVVKVNVFLRSMDDFAKMNEVYKTYWGDVKPART